jgi:molybdopterin biosynthesis enzyme MoaB
MIRVAILTVSDSAAAGTREDRSGPALEERVLALGWMTALKRLVRDEVYEISAEVSALEFPRATSLPKLFAPSRRGKSPVLVK